MNNKTLSQIECLDMFHHNLSLEDESIEINANISKS